MAKILTQSTDKQMGTSMKMYHTQFCICILIVLGVGVQFAWEYPNYSLGGNALNAGIFLFAFLTVITVFNGLINHSKDSTYIAIPCVVALALCIGMRIYLYQGVGQQRLRLLWYRDYFANCNNFKTLFQRLKFQPLKFCKFKIIK